MQGISKEEDDERDASFRKLLNREPVLEFIVHSFTHPNLKESDVEDALFPPPFSKTGVKALIWEVVDCVRLVNEMKEKLKHILDKSMSNFTLLSESAQVALEYYLNVAMYISKDPPSIPSNQRYASTMQVPLIKLKLSSCLFVRTREWEKQNLHLHFPVHLITFSTVPNLKVIYACFTEQSRKFWNLFADNLKEYNKQRGKNCYNSFKFVSVESLAEYKELFNCIGFLVSLLEASLSNLATFKSYNRAQANIMALKHEPMNFKEAIAKLDNLLCKEKGTVSASSLYR